GSDIVRLLGDEEAAQPAHVSLDRELIELLESAATLPDEHQRLARKRYEVGLVGRDADIVKPIVGKERLGWIPAVAGHASALAVEQIPSALGGFADGLLIAVDKVIERRIEGDLGALVGGDRLLDVIHRDLTAKYFLERLLIRRYGLHTGDDV